MKEIDREAPLCDEEPDEGGGSVDGECILVPDGEYELRYVDYETARCFGRPKVIVHFAIIGPEEYAGLPIDRFYNAKKLTRSLGRYGKYSAPRRGDLIREFRRLTGRDCRPDRIYLARLKAKRIVGDIQTVTRDHRHEPLSESDQYSRISRLVSVLPDDHW